MNVKIKGVKDKLKISMISGRHRRVCPGRRAPDVPFFPSPVAHIRDDVGALGRRCPESPPLAPNVSRYQALRDQEVPQHHGTFKNFLEGAQLFRPGQLKLQDFPEPQHFGDFTTRLSSARVKTLRPYI